MIVKDAKETKAINWFERKLLPWLMIDIKRVWSGILTDCQKKNKINFLFNLFRNLYGAIINMKLLKAHGERFLLYNLTLYQSPLQLRV